jgi:hypothetical protein
MRATLRLKYSAGDCWVPALEASPGCMTDETEACPLEWPAAAEDLEKALGVLPEARSSDMVLRELYEGEERGEGEREEISEIGR